MIQDIEPHHLDNQYKPVPPDKDSIALYYEDHAALMKVSEKGISFPSFADLEHLNREIYKECIYLFSVDDERYYLVNEIDRSMLLDFQMKNTEIFRTADPQDRAFAGITGYQLYNWYKDRKYCGRCGKRLKHGEKERMLVCEACGNTEFPKICPAVIVGVTDHNRILMSKYAGRTYKKYALLAGFSEIGETVEQTVAREVMEEVGLKVKNIRYYKSQPWAFSDTLLMGFYCDLDGNDAITLDREELAVAEWFEREDIPVEPSRDSLTNEMILQFKNERTAVKTLDYLADYTEFHFGEEEKLQESINYPAIAEHKKEHDKLRAVVKDLYNMLEEEEGPSEAFVEQVNKNVIEWLYRHIKGFDRSVAEYKFMNESSERL